MPLEMSDSGIAEEMHRAQAFQDGVITLVKYEERGVIRREVGVAYSILDAKLIIGPYFEELAGIYPKNFLNVPADLKYRVKKIPLEDIVHFAVIDCDGILGNVQYVLRNLADR